MPTYALLGATGSTGSAILRCLLATPTQDLVVNIFIRNKAKLLEAFPSLESSPPFKVFIFEGSLNDTMLMRTCLQGVDVIFGVIATNVSSRGMSICCETAAAIIEALKFHQQQSAVYKAPTVVQLRSASVNKLLKAAMPWAVRNMAEFCFHYCYEDIRRASALFISAAEGPLEVLHYIFVDPPAIHDPEGVAPTGYSLIVDGIGKQESALSYSDLGASFCELAARRDEFRDKEVGPSATGKVNLTVDKLLPFVIAGAKGRVFG